MPHESNHRSSTAAQAGFRGARRWIALSVASLIVVLMLRAESQAPPVLPHNFGVKDGSIPEDPREADRRDFPMWPVNSEMPNDSFTFARLRYNSTGGRWHRHGNWLTDYPDSDLNFSFRLQQLTSLQVNPLGAIVDIDPEQLRHYPFIYMLEVGGISLTILVWIAAYAIGGGR